ncbi:lanthionine synthetase C family protein [Paenibacillus sp. FSL W8-0187]|uniref:lanthionine synthetase C family protein n=1 Tax=unclassified Paenibacillus TaxID=185978 RepID=UPI0030DD277E
MRTSCLKEQSISISKLIAERLVDLPYIENIAVSPTNRSPSRGTAPWNPISLADGIPGIWVLFAEWDRLEPDRGWKESIHQHLLSLYRAMPLRIPDISLYSGVTGIAYGLFIASDDRTNYKQALSQLNQYIASQFTEGRKIPGLDSLDVVSGLCGVARYVLEASRYDDRMREIAVPLITNIIGESQSMIDAVLCGMDRQVQHGIAHGLAGILALLVTALHKQVEVENLQHTIHRIADYLALQIREDRYGRFWPISSKPSCSYRSEEEETRQIEGWCHGTLGVSLTLLRAGIYCSNEGWKKVAAEAAGSTFRLGENELGSMTPSFCHGLAGLLHLANHLHALCDIHEASLFADRVASRLMKMFDESSPFGYRDQEDTVCTDNPGLLQGAVGIALSLLDYGKRDDPIYLGKWRELFLMS